MNLIVFFPAVRSVNTFTNRYNLNKVQLKYLLVIFILINCVHAQQNVAVQWSKVYKDSVHPYFAVYSSTLDKHGNFYAAGEIQTTGSPVSVWNITTVKFSPSGVPALFDCYETTTKQTLFGTHIIVDDSGASYVAGIRYPTNSSSEGILLKYSPEGHIDWVKRCPVYPYSCQVAQDSTGKIYFLINTDMGIGVWKLNRSGETTDSILITDSVSIEGRSVLLSDSGNVYIVGNRSYTRTSGESIMPISYNDALIIKLDFHCHIIWKKAFLNKMVILGLRDKLNNIVVLGQGILSKYTSSGDSIWQKNTDRNAAYTGLAIDSHNRIIIVGYGTSEFSHDGAVMYDPSGNIKWRQNLSYLPMINYYAVALDSADNIYISGELNENPNGVLCLATKLDTAGNQIWKTTFKAPGYLYNISYFLILDDSANVYVGSSSFNRDAAGYFVIKYRQYYSPDLVKTFSSIITDYSLAQNYPNPFNPSTLISYNIPVSSFVSLKIYDLLGKEIKSLVNEQKIAGRYSIKFNAADLPSGVYFYRIRAIPDDRQSGSFVSTKKFVLLK